jgi:hypothetical protein
MTTPTEALELAREWLTWSAWADRITKDSVGHEPSVSDQAKDGIAVADATSRALIDLAAKCERYERVVEAVREWHSWYGTDDAEIFAAMDEALYAAVDALEIATRDPK